MSRRELEAAFPNLAADGYAISSPKSQKYNCISWAAGDISAKWDCTGLPMVGYYWPEGATIGEGVDALVSAFRTQGYEVCENASLEAGYEMIAVYADALDMWTHAAKQLPDGRWSSKMGDGEDIWHSTLRGVSGAIYGEVKLFMRRAVGRPGIPERKPKKPARKRRRKKR